MRAPILVGGQQFTVVPQLRAQERQRPRVRAEAPRVREDVEGTLGIPFDAETEPAKPVDEQPTTQITQTGVQGGTQENFRDFEEAGITLQISPTISACNAITRASRSSLASRGTSSSMSDAGVPGRREYLKEKID